MEPVADEGECHCCCDDITDENRCLYNTDQDETWKEAFYCVECVRFIKSIGFKSYIKAAEASDCAKELAGLLRAGPPIWIADDGLPVPDGQHVFWFRSVDGDPELAQYDGAVIGEERQRLWDILIMVIQPCIEMVQAEQVAMEAAAEERIMREKMERMKLDSSN